MAIYRQVQTAFWQDDFVLQLTPEEKYFYLYLLTNSKTKQCGIYQLPMQVIILETGYNQETAEKLLKRFWDYGKIIYNTRTREIAIINWAKYNPMESPKIKACVERELKDVKDKSLISTIYPDRYPMVGVHLHLPSNAGGTSVKPGMEQAKVKPRRDPDNHRIHFEIQLF